jgi:hypothetical protein
MRKQANQEQAKNLGQKNVSLRDRIISGDSVETIVPFLGTTLSALADSGIFAIRAILPFAPP